MVLNLSAKILTTVAFVTLVTLAVVVRADTVVIPTTSFSSYSVFESFWAYLYPWGSDHNGSARMVGNSTDHSHIVIASNTLSLIATPTTGASPPTSTANPNPAIHYASGAIHANSQITVTTTTGYQVQGEFIPPTALGTWPAFWLTAVQGWPPEVLNNGVRPCTSYLSGTAQNWFNTFNTSSIVKSDIVTWPTDGNFHALKAVLSAANSADVKIEFYLDNVLQTTQVGAGFVGKAMWLIINLQMEGSSGSPGPTGTTTYKIRNVEVTQLT
ncbi:glycoside hydrolase family 16 protein [Ramaria rubella]|nr:glycoside hydrolase family 16 protein [Ramaria rubella]